MNLQFEDANRLSPSPLNGERAGVRGENGPVRPLWFMAPMRVRCRIIGFRWGEVTGISPGRSGWGSSSRTCR
jgi:hypothetical protein